MATKPKPTQGVESKRVAMDERESEWATIKRYNRATNTYDEDHVELGRGYMALPYDLPLHLFVDRLIKKEHVEAEPIDHGNGHTRPPISALAGWTLTVDAYAFGVKFYIRYGRDGTLKLFTEDATDGVVKLEEWRKG